MAWSGDLGRGGALLIALLGAAACTKGTDPFPPPRPADTSGAGGNGGAGGATGGGGAAAVPNLCECTFELTYDDGCAGCVNDANNPSAGACKAELGQCVADSGCYDILTCPSACAMVPVNQRVACITACLVPFANDAPHELAAAYLSCACAHCASACGGSQKIVCE